MKATFQKCFRIIFAIFFLYLVGEGFNHWDSFRMFASFSEFIPSIALITTLSIIPLAISIFLIWILLVSFEWFFNRIRWKINVGHAMFFTSFFVLISVLTRISKRLIWPSETTTIYIKLVVLIYVFVISILLTGVLSIGV